jgi:hypothetical protein
MAIKFIKSVLLKLVTGRRFYMGGGGAKKSMYDNPMLQLQAQQQVDAENLRANRFDEYGPTGTTKWIDGSKVTTLNQPQQELYNQTTNGQIGAATQANNGQYKDILDRSIGTGKQYQDYATGRMGAAAGVLDKDISGGDMAQRQRVEDSLMERMRPSLERDQNQLAQSLANQGLAPGSEAYTNAMSDQSRRVNDARLGVIGQGTQEMQATQGMDLAKRNQVMGEQSGLLGLASQDANVTNAPRNQAMAERSGLMQQGGNATMPSYTGTNGDPARQNIAQMMQTYAGNQNSQQQAKQAGKNGAMSSGLGAASTIGAAALLSDRRLKENIEKVGTTKHGFNLYEFNYINDPSTRYEGVMADEIENIMPEAVATNDAGYKSVYYDKLGIEMREV